MEMQRSDNVTRPQLRPTLSLARKVSVREATERVMGPPVLPRIDFHQGPFADVPVTRAFPLGPKVLTTDWRRLVDRLRLEANNQQDVAREMRDANAVLEKKGRDARNENVSLRLQVQTLKTGLAEVLGDLSDAQNALNQLDSALNDTRVKRISRRLIPRDEVSGIAERPPMVRQETASMLPPLA